MKKYRHLRGDLIEVFKMVHKYYELSAVVKLTFNTFNSTRGNKYIYCKNASHYNLRKFSFCSLVVNIWNSLPHSVVDTTNLSK